jgi:hypothetical protein
MIRLIALRSQRAHNRFMSIDEWLEPIPDAWREYPKHIAEAIG